jgi:uncharacterized alpha-E superfamily protein
LPSLLARYADGLFWMARYVERAENLARLLDVNHSYAREGPGGDDWISMVQINDDEERFLASHAVADPASVTAFYLSDAANPTSIRFAVRAARDNARMLRSLISIEMWAQLNMFHNWLKELTAEPVRPPDLPRLCTIIKEACQTHTGITEGTFFRDQGWYFYQLGRYVERADQTTRLLDVGFRRAMARNEAAAPLEAGRWAKLLRSAAGYQAFRRIHSHGMVPAEVVGFLLYDGEFPRSVRLCIGEIDTLLHGLRQRHGLRGGGAALELVDGLRGELPAERLDALMAGGLHQFIDWIQEQLIGISEALRRDFFARA